MLRAALSARLSRLQNIVLYQIIAGISKTPRSVALGMAVMTRVKREGSRLCSRFGETATVLHGGGDRLDA